MSSHRQGGRSLFSALFTSAWNSLGSWLGTYDAVDPRNTAMRGVIARPTTAIDLAVTTPYLRNLCRNYERNNAWARAATEGLVANVIGSGIGLEPDTGDPDVDHKIREQWVDYIRDCFVDGTDLYEGQRFGFRDIVVGGECLWRLIVDNERSKDGRIPLCIVPLEPEWFGDSGQTVVGMTEGYVGGIKLDQYGRPVSYSLTAPSGKHEEIPAKFIIHAFEKRRALQVRGEPWFAPIVTTLRQEKDLVMSELEAAKNTAGFAAAITTHGGTPPDIDERGEKTRDISLGAVLELSQGEDIKLLSHTRPSQQIKPFLEMLKGDMAGALRLGRRWIDRDISNANYTSMRADMLDNDRLLGPVREWCGHQLAGRLYKAVLPYLAIKAGVELPRATYRLTPDGQPYVDPQKDAEAAALAISYGLSTFEAEIGKRGGDYKQVWQKLAEEKALLDKLGLELQSPGGTPPLEHESEEVVDENGQKPPTKEERQKLLKLREQIKKSLTVQGVPLVKETEDMTREDFLTGMRALADGLKQPAAPAQVTLVNETRMDQQTAEVMGTAIGKAIPKAEAPIINVAAPNVEVDVPAPVVNVAAPNVTIEPADVKVNVTAPTVNVAAPDVTVENNVTTPARTVIATPNGDGSTTIRPID